MQKELGWKEEEDGMMLRENFLEASRVQKAIYQAKNKAGRSVVPFKQGEQPV